MLYERKIKKKKKETVTGLNWMFMIIEGDVCIRVVKVPAAC